MKGISILLTHLKQNPKGLIIHIWTLVALIYVGFVVLPNFLPVSCSTYNCQEKKVEDFLFFTEANRPIGKDRWYNSTSIEHSLFLRFSDGSNLKLTDRYSHYWYELSDSSIIGKHIMFYPRHCYPINRDPVAFKVEGKTIFSVLDGRMFEFGAIGALLVLLFLSYLIIKDSI